MSTQKKSPHNPQLDALLAESGWVLQLAKRLTRDWAAAEDIAQSTLALALERQPDTKGSLRPWLAKVASRLARHRVRSDVRRQAREAQVSSSSRSTAGLSSSSSDEVLMRFELHRDIAKRVDALPALSAPL
ncbi:MAG: sigma factor [Planctomycetota bacterium]